MSEEQYVRVEITRSNVFVSSGVPKDIYIYIIVRCFRDVIDDMSTDVIIFPEMCPRCLTALSDSIGLFVATHDARTQFVGKLRANHSTVPATVYNFDVNISGVVEIMLETLQEKNVIRGNHTLSSILHRKTGKPI